MKCIRKTSFLTLFFPFIADAGRTVCSLAPNNVVRWCISAIRGNHPHDNEPTYSCRVSFGVCAAVRILEAKAHTNIIPGYLFFVGLFCWRFISLPFVFFLNNFSCFKAELNEDDIPALAVGFMKVKQCCILKSRLGIQFKLKSSSLACIRRLVKRATSERYTLLTPLFTL